MTEITRFEDLKGHTLSAVEQVAIGPYDDEVRFTLADGRQFRLWHCEDCCESVRVEDICGDLADLIGSPLLMAEEVTSEDRPSDLPEPEYEPESETWAFYKLATARGYVTIRWHGTSNGYYSESVDFGPVL